LVTVVQTCALPISRLLKSVEDVVLEVCSLAVGSVFITRTVEVRHAGHILAEHGGEIDLEGSVLGQRHVAGMKVPQGRENPLARLDVSLPQRPGQNLAQLAQHAL